MVRDEQKRLQNRENGSLGGNPALLKAVNPPDNQVANRNPTPSVSTSSPSVSVKTPVVPKSDLQSKARRGSKSGQAAIHGIDAEALQDTAAVQEWFFQNAEALGMNRTNHSHFREVLTWVEEAQRGEKPGGLFITLAKKYAAGTPPEATSEAEERAKARHTEWNRSHATPNPIIQQLADQFTLSTGEPAA
jgi:hypothetical protein